MFHLNELSHNHQMERRYLVDSSQTAKERKWLEARNQEFDGMFLSLHTDKDKGLLTEQRFLKLMAALEQEQKTSQKPPARPIHEAEPGGRTEKP